MDANQRWDVDEAISYMKQLAKFKPVWIEEPTSPDDVLGKVQPDNTLNWFFLMILNFYRAKKKVNNKLFKVKWNTILSAKGVCTYFVFYSCF